ncbi:sulfatase-like hydrolase/transferase [Paenibacillus sp. CC-CFT747]|nr:sulfatase-like hydrolase/transferase [Paenibacillus sp. CC-CFT747]
MSNIIILMSDEHNPFISSVYGHPSVQTPNMERLARMGTVYASAYSPSPLCMPARSAFMSGRRVHELETYSNCRIHVKGGHPSYGSVLREQGIYTAHIGKADVYDPGEALGFSEMRLNKNRKKQGDLNFRRRPLAVRQGAAARAMNFGVRADAFDGDNAVIEEALQWLDEKALTLDVPWSMTVNILNPHFPQWNTEELWNLYEDGADGAAYPPPERDGESAGHPYARDLREHFQTEAFTEEQIRGLRRGYLGNVTYVDRQLGRLLDKLEETGLAANTNLIYVSDHGDMQGKFGMWWKCSLYEPSARVPCIAAGPDFASGAVVRTPVDLHDVQAAIFRSVGAARPEDWVGRPLQDIETDDPDRVVFAEYHGHGTRSGAYMIRKGAWKLLYYMEGPHQLFNLESDPEELVNLWDRESAKTAELEAELRRICSPEEENDKAHRFQEEQLREIETAPLPNASAD